MKVPELKCTWHKSAECMGNGVILSLLVPKATSDELVPIGAWCSESAQWSWLGHQATFETPQNAMGAKRRPKPAHPEKRPLVATRQPRRSLAPRRTE